MPCSKTRRGLDGRDRPDVALLDGVVTGAAHAKADLARVRVGVPDDWINAAGELSEEVAAALAAGRAALAGAGATVDNVDGMLAVLGTNKDTFPMPVMPVPFEDATARCRSTSTATRASSRRRPTRSSARCSRGAR